MLKRGLLIRDCTSFRGLDKFFVRVAIRTHLDNQRLLKAFRDILSNAI